MKRTMAVILAGGEGERLSILSSVRAKPAVPFGGKYRIIDFTLSNCVNSDVSNVVVLTQYNPRSLNDHIGLGRPWDLDRNNKVVEWQEKPKHPKSDLASTGVYVFSKRALRKWLSEDRHDFGRDVIPAMLDGGARVFGYHFDGYWQDVGTVQSYWEANLA